MDVVRITLVGMLLALPLAGLRAQITLDGALGRAGALAGPDYAITADLGRQMGGNLFHSFGRFNLSRHESATFSGPDSVLNIIGRVTGGQQSHIDGRLISTIPGADLWFINPAGVVFGRHASLSVQGSFHVSTADVLRLADGGQFAAAPPQNSMLTSAPPSAFGFLDDSPAALAIEGGASFTVGEGKDFSVVGGDIAIRGATLEVPDGHLRLASVAAAAEVALDGTGLDIQSISRQGDIVLSSATVSSSGPASGGRIVIRAGRLVVEENSTIAAESNALPGLGIDIEVEQLVVERSSIETGTRGSGAGGGLRIRAEVLEILTGKIAAEASRNSTGDAGDIGINVGRLVLRDGAEVSSDSLGPGSAGDVTVEAREAIVLSGRAPNAPLDRPRKSGISSNTFAQGAGGPVTVRTPRLDLQDGAISSNTLCENDTCGDGGEVRIEAGRIRLLEGSQILSGSFGPGVGGDVAVTASESIRISGKDINGLTSGVFASTEGAGQGGSVEIRTPALEMREGFIAADSLCSACGDAGQVRVEAGRIRLLEGGQIASLTVGEGRGGNVTVTARDAIHIAGLAFDDVGNEVASGIDVGTVGGGGPGGSIAVMTPLLDVRDGGAVSASSLCPGCGPAGDIAIRAGRLDLSSAAISTTAATAGGGSIDIASGALVTLADGGITTSVAGGDASAGNIAIANPVALTLVDASRIQANTFGGRGGFVRIAADTLLRSADSLIEAEARSRLGIAGVVEVDTPDVDISASLTVLPGEFQDPAARLRPPCGTRQSQEISTFRVTGRGGLPLAPAAGPPAPAADPCSGLATNSADRDKRWPWPR